MTSLRYRVLICFASVALVGASCPASDCACPPGLTSARLYGRVTAAGQPLAGATVRIRANASSCTGVDIAGETFVTDTSGYFGGTIVSVFSPDVRCVHLTAVRQLPAGLDSIIAAPLLLAFKGDAPIDSAGIVFAFP